MKLALKPLSDKLLEHALNDFDKLVKILRQHPKGKDIERKVRTMESEILTQIWMNGLLPTLTFYLAKGEEDNFKAIKEAFEQGKSSFNVEDSVEKLAYAAMLYLILRELKRLNILKGNFGNPRGCIHELIEMGFLKRMYASRVLSLYLYEFKKLCEAVFEPER